MGDPSIVDHHNDLVNMGNRDYLGNDDVLDNDIDSKMDQDHQHVYRVDRMTKWDFD